MERAAIIGTGIAGMASARFLAGRYRLTIYEKNDYVGGHTNTVIVREADREVPIDTGFMVYNEVTYPSLTQLLARLGVESVDAPMSFSVQHKPSGLEWCGSGLSGLFARRRNLFSPRHYRFLAEIHRFNRDAVSILDDPGAAGMSLAEYAARERHTREFLERYLVPMSSAVWSTDPAAMAEFPAVTLVRFFRNHGFLGLHTQHRWKTIAGGSRVYRDRLVAPFRDRIRCGRPAVRVSRAGTTALVTDDRGDVSSYDAVVLACHADQALGLLADPTRKEDALLGSFRYQPNAAVLHTDPAVMPATRRAWSSWNSRLEVRDGRSRTSTVYWMNSLQRVSRTRDYFISLGDPGSVRPDRILRTIDYRHPIFTTGAIRAQEDLPLLNLRGPVYFCGSYFRYGFHEDALNSAIALARRLTGRPVWN